MSLTSRRKAEVYFEIEEIMRQNIVVTGLVLIYLASKKTSNGSRIQRRRYSLETESPRKGEEPEVTSVYKPENEVTPKSSKRGKKRKSVDSDTTSGIINILCKYLKGSESRYGEVARLTGYEEYAATYRKEVFQIIDSLEVFPSLAENARRKNVLMLLEGMIKSESNSIKKFSD